MAHCLPAWWRNLSRYCCPLRQYDVFWAKKSTDRRADSRRCTHTSDYNSRVKYIVRHWASREASLRHSSGWGTEAFPLSSGICAPMLYTKHFTSLFHSSFSKGLQKMLLFLLKASFAIAIFCFTSWQQFRLLLILHPKYLKLSTCSTDSSLIRMSIFLIGYNYHQYFKLWSPTIRLLNVTV